MHLAFDIGGRATLCGLGGALFFLFLTRNWNNSSKQFSYASFLLPPFFLCLLSLTIMVTFAATLGNAPFCLLKRCLRWSTHPIIVWLWAKVSDQVLVCSFYDSSVHDCFIICFTELWLPSLLEELCHYDLLLCSNMNFKKLWPQLHHGMCLLFDNHCCVANLGAIDFGRRIVLHRSDMHMLQAYPFIHFNGFNITSSFLLHLIIFASMHEEVSKRKERRKCRSNICQVNATVKTL